jgi:hypothetical protein
MSKTKSIPDPTRGKIDLFGGKRILGQLIFFGTIPI